MDIKRKVMSPGSQGNSASEISDILQRACDWQYGRAATANDIEDESREEDLAFGVPHEALDFDPKMTPVSKGHAPEGAHGRAAVHALGRTKTTGNFKKIEEAHGKGAAIAAYQNKLKAHKAGK